MYVLYVLAADLGTNSQSHQCLQLRLHQFKDAS